MVATLAEDPSRPWEKFTVSFFGDGRVEFLVEINGSLLKITSSLSHTYRFETPTGTKVDLPRELASELASLLNLRELVSREEQSLHGFRNRAIGTLTAFFHRDVQTKTLGVSFRAILLVGMFWIPWRIATCPARYLLSPRFRQFLKLNRWRKNREAAAVGALMDWHESLKREK